MRFELCLSGQTSQECFSVYFKPEDYLLLIFLVQNGANVGKSY